MSRARANKTKNSLNYVLPRHAHEVVLLGEAGQAKARWVCQWFAFTLE